MFLAIMQNVLPAGKLHAECPLVDRMCNVNAHNTVEGCLSTVGPTVWQVMHIVFLKCSLRSAKAGSWDSDRCLSVFLYRSLHLFQQLRGIAKLG